MVMSSPHIVILTDLSIFLIDFSFSMTSQSRYL